MVVEAAGHAVDEAPTAPRALKAVADDDFSVVFLDLNLAGDSGLDVLTKMLETKPDLSVVIFTAFANIATAVEAMRRGAFDFVPKPFTPDQIRAVLGKVVKNRTLEKRVKALETQIAEDAPAVTLESEEPLMQRALEVAFKAAPTAATLLILGPSGTGKSVLAREVHKRSTRSEAAFVTVNCPSLSRELLESELFGHVKGAYTGATTDTQGKVASAEGGTLFLDEIGEVPLEIQPKLLRLLQEREYERVGEARSRKADVRMIAATNRNLADEVKQGRFREDLFYRLNVISVPLPGLRERRGDLLRLAEGYEKYFSARMGKRVSGFSPAVEKAFLDYPWPGNLRELRNIVERAVILTLDSKIQIHDLPEDFTGHPDNSVAVGARVTLDELETEHIRRILQLAKNLDEAARLLGIDPATLYRKRQKLGLI